MVKGGIILRAYLLLFMILLFSARILIEFVKNDQVPFEAAMKFNMGQWLSMPFILAGVVMIAIAGRLLVDGLLALWP